MGQFQHPFKNLRENYLKLKERLPRKASDIANLEFKGNFKRQGYRDDSGGVQKWKKRKSTSKKDEGRALLIKTGRLRRGVRSAPLPGVARVINAVPYAQVQNEGFKGNVSVKAHRRRSRSKDLYSTKTKKVSRKGYVQKDASEHQRDLPARPFMITTKPLINDINAFVTKELKLLFS